MWAKCDHRLQACFWRGQQPRMTALAMEQVWTGVGRHVECEQGVGKAYAHASGRLFRGTLYLARGAADDTVQVRRGVRKPPRSCHKAQAVYLGVLLRVREWCMRC